MRSYSYDEYCSKYFFWSGAQSCCQQWWRTPNASMGQKVLDIARSAMLSSSWASASADSGLSPHQQPSALSPLVPNNVDSADIGAELEDTPRPPRRPVKRRLTVPSLSSLSPAHSGVSFAAPSSDVVKARDDNDATYDDHVAFRTKEARRRSRNLNLSIRKSASNLTKRDSARVLVTSLKATQLFLSHCWRNVDIKPQKEEMFSYLTEKARRLQYLPVRVFCAPLSAAVLEDVGNDANRVPVVVNLL